MEKERPEITAANMREIAGNGAKAKLDAEIDWWLISIELAAKNGKFSADRSESMSDACKKHLESREFRVIQNSTIEENTKEIWISTTVYW